MNGATEPTPYTQLSRDPFARYTLIRRKASDGRCQCCGMHGRRWEYGSESDAGRIAWSETYFCGVACMRAYFF